MPPEDPDALAAAIIRYFAEEKAESFKKNVDEEKERFSWERMVETIEGLYTETVEGK